MNKSGKEIPHCPVCIASVFKRGNSAINRGCFSCTVFSLNPQFEQNAPALLFWKMKDTHL